MYFVIIILLIILIFYLFFKLGIAEVFFGFVGLVLGLVMYNSEPCNQINEYIGSGDSELLDEVEKFVYQLDMKDHQFDENKLKDVPKETMDVINGNPVEISHIDNNAEFADKYYRVLDLTNKTPYKERKYIFKKTLHWGQLKLMLTEIEFLTMVIKNHRLNKDDRPIYMIYPGSSPGHHLYFLSEMFPDIHFELYDPNPFIIENTEKIKIHVQFYKEKECKYWAEQQKDKYVILCSDIRIEPATEKSVQFDMELQLSWWKIMNPEYTMFKFRLPWKPGKTEYAEGEFYVQPFPGPTSTETRIIIKKNAKLVKYDNTDYEQACFTHNTVNRLKRYEIVDYKGKSHNVNLLENRLCHCYDCATFVHIINQYIDLTGVGDTFDIINNIQNKITFGRNDLLTQTKVEFRVGLDIIVNSLFKNCNNKKCKVCTQPVTSFSRHKVRKSKATKKAVLSNK